jgi:hypothetical protein
MLTIRSTQTLHGPISVASLYRAEAARLRRLHNQIREIYGQEIELSTIIDAMVEELDAVDVQNLIR